MNDKDKEKEYLIEISSLRDVIEVSQNRANELQVKLEKMVEKLNNVRKIAVQKGYTIILDELSDK